MTPSRKSSLHQSLQELVTEYTWIMQLLAIILPQSDKYIPLLVLVKIGKGGFGDGRGVSPLTRHAFLEHDCVIWWTPVDHLGVP